MRCLLRVSIHEAGIIMAISLQVSPQAGLALLATPDPTASGSAQAGMPVSVDLTLAKPAILKTEEQTDADIPLIADTTFSPSFLRRTSSSASSLAPSSSKRASRDADEISPEPPAEVGHEFIKAAREGFSFVLGPVGAQHASAGVASQGVTATAQIAASSNATAAAGAHAGDGLKDALQVQHGQPASGSTLHAGTTGRAAADGAALGDESVEEPMASLSTWASDQAAAEKKSFAAVKAALDLQKVISSVLHSAILHFTDLAALMADFSMSHWQAPRSGSKIPQRQLLPWDTRGVSQETIPSGSSQGYMHGPGTPRAGVAGP